MSARIVFLLISDTIDINDKKTGETLDCHGEYHSCSDARARSFLQAYHRGMLMHSIAVAPSLRKQVFKRSHQSEAEPVRAAVVNRKLHATKNQSHDDVKQVADFVPVCSHQPLVDRLQSPHNTQCQIQAVQVTMLLFVGRSSEKRTFICVILPPLR